MASRYLPATRRLLAFQRDYTPERRELDSCTVWWAWEGEDQEGNSSSP